MPPWLKDSAVLVALITVGGGLLGTLMSAVVNFFVERVKSTKDRQFEVLTERMTDLSASVQVVKETVEINSHKLEHLEEATGDVKQAEKKTQRYRLFQDLTRALVSGHTTIAAFRELSILFDSYKALGGNGEIEALYEEYSKLPKEVSEYED